MPFWCRHIATRATAATTRAIATGHDQFHTGPKVKATEAARMPTASAAVPTRSIATTSCERERGARGANEIAATAMRATTTNTARQPSTGPNDRAASAPPATCPTAAPIPPLAPKAAIARVRAAPREVAWMVPRTWGVHSAAPTPCTTRAAMSVSMEGARAQAIADTRNSPIPSV